MIEFFIEHEAINPNVQGYRDWLLDVASQHGSNISNIAYILTTDEHLLELNRAYLNHDYYTDILTFDLSEGADLSGDVFISLDRVKENAEDGGVSFVDELRRVMAHGLLHLLGFNDKTVVERGRMRGLEDKAMKMFHVKQ